MLRLSSALIFFVILLSCNLALTGGRLFQSETYDYCDPKLKLCEVPGDHTMCKFSSAGLSARCSPNLQEPLGAADKTRILLLHNRFRNAVATGSEKNKYSKLPTSSNMRQIYWDEELEKISTRWAEQCVSTTGNPYDKCRNTKRFVVSQNVGTRQVNGTGVGKQTQQIVLSWFRVSKDFDPDLIDKFQLYVHFSRLKRTERFSTVRHNKPAIVSKILPRIIINKFKIVLINCVYEFRTNGNKTRSKDLVNIIWGETYAMGCARVLFQEELPVTESELKKKSVWHMERLVCNYGPGSSESGKSIYKRGVPCENCPQGTECSSQYSGLCAIQNNTEKINDSQRTATPRSFSPDVLKSREQGKSFDENSKSELMWHYPEDGVNLHGEEATTEIHPGNASSLPPIGTTRCLEKECRRENTAPGNSNTNRITIKDFTPHKIEDMLKSAKSPARLVSEELGKRETNSENGWDKTVVIYKKQKWTVPNGKRPVREVLKRKPTMAEENEKNCKCFDLVQKAIVSMQPVSNSLASKETNTQIWNQPRRSIN
ncbi:hypothetical protein RUM43_003763 [Polyplax serrata]|uniref:SCP domain-containing protein n=1 Tax=Polyplax serrata TaxID=468196 RepID=A0AAN8PG07_POLSC